MLAHDGFAVPAVGIVGTLSRTTATASDAAA